MVFIANHQPPVVLQPSEEAFDLPSSSVSSERPSVLGLGSFSSVPMWRNHFDVPVILQSLIKPVAVVCLVPNDPNRPFIEERCVKRPLNERHFMRRSAGHVHGDRKTRSVCHCHDLAALASLGFSHCGAPFLAGANVPSMKASRKSISPRSCKSSARATSMRSKTPCDRQCWSQRWHVWYGGYRAGMSFHGAPVLRTQSMPSRTSRGGVAGLPLPPSRLFEGGTNGAIRSHCSLVRSIWTSSSQHGEVSRNFYGNLKLFLR